MNRGINLFFIHKGTGNRGRGTTRSSLFPVFGLNFPQPLGVRDPHLYRWIVLVCLYLFKSATKTYTVACCLFPVAFNPRSTGMRDFVRVMKCVAVNHGLWVETFRLNISRRWAGLFFPIALNPHFLGVLSFPYLHLPNFLVFAIGSLGDRRGNVEVERQHQQTQPETELAGAVKPWHAATIKLHWNIFFLDGIKVI